MDRDRVPLHRGSWCVCVTGVLPATAGPGVPFPGSLATKPVVCFQHGGTRSRGTPRPSIDRQDALAQRGT